MARKSTRKGRQPSQGTGRRQGYFSGPGPDGIGLKDGDPGSGSEGYQPRCKFFPKGQPVPASLILQLDAPLEGGKDFARQQLNRPVLLIYAQDPAFACCWFSRPIDLGDESGNPAFWMLQKTARDSWFLCLRRVSGQLAAYNLKSKSAPFPIKLKKGQTTKVLKWPRTITISQGG
jgi:hypothetical protein